MGIETGAGHNTDRPPQSGTDKPQTRTDNRPGEPRSRLEAIGSYIAANEIAETRARDARKAASNEFDRNDTAEHTAYGRICLEYGGAMFVPKGVKDNHVDVLRLNQAQYDAALAEIGDRLKADRAANKAEYETNLSKFNDHGKA